MKSIIENRIKNIMETFDIKNEGDAFAVFAVSLINEISDNEAYDYTDTLDKGDKGIDGWTLNSEIFNLYQCKYSKDESKVYGEPEIKELLNGLEDLLNDKVKLSNKLNEIRDIIKEHLEHGKSITLNWVIVGKMCESGIEYLHSKISNIEKDLRDKFTCNDININTEIYDFDRLHEVYVNQNCSDNLSGYIMKIPITSSNNIIELDKPNNDSGIDKSIVINLKAKEFVNVIKKDKLGSRIFDLNVRFNLGTRNKVNTNIKQTAIDKDLCKNFWHYNNGVTILVEDYLFSKENGVELINLTNPQIVNGCQTISTLINISKELKDSENPLILTKIIKVTTDELGRKQALRISTATNSQSPVKVSDLKSNDPVQKSIQARFKEYKYFYERKRREWDTLTKSEKKYYKENKKITMEDLGKYWYSFIGHPSESICNKEIIFSDECIYNDIYKKDREIELYILSYKLYELFSEELGKNKIDNLVKKYRFEKEDAELIVNKVIVIAHCLSISRVLIEEKHGKINVDIAKKIIKLLSEESKFKSELITVVLRSIKNEVKSKNGEDKLKIFKIDKTIKILEDNSKDIYDDRVEDNDNYLDFR